MRRGKKITIAIITYILIILIEPYLSRESFSPLSIPLSTTNSLLRNIYIMLSTIIYITFHSFPYYYHLYILSPTLFHFHLNCLLIYIIYSPTPFNFPKGLLSSRHHPQLKPTRQDYSQPKSPNPPVKTFY